MAMTDSQEYSKRLVAQHSPKNGCNAPDGAALIVRPKKNVPTKTVVQHTFENAENGKEKSKYGWVEETSTFTLDDFVREHLGEGQRKQRSNISGLC